MSKSKYPKQITLTRDKFPSVAGTVYTLITSFEHSDGSLGYYDEPFYDSENYSIRCPDRIWARDLHLYSEWFSYNKSQEDLEQTEPEHISIKKEDFEVIHSLIEKVKNILNIK